MEGQSTDIQSQSKNSKKRKGEMMKPGTFDWKSGTVIFLGFK